MSKLMWHKEKINEEIGAWFQNGGPPWNKNSIDS